MTNNILGIDIAKRKFDCCFLLEDGRKISAFFSNDEAGFKQLLNQLESFNLGPFRVALEATGRYGHGLARFLHAHGHVVSLINPVCTCNFAKSKLLRNKTDKVDAALVALYLKEIQPVPWTPPSDFRYELQQLTRRILSRKHELTKERNRLQDPGQSKAILSDIKKSIRTLESSIQTLEKAVAKVIQADPTLRTQAQLLCSIDGIGGYTAAIILAELPPVESFKSASQAVAYAGLSPRQVSSGSSLKGRSKLCKTGNRYLRQALFMPSVCALRCNARLQAKAARLKAAGKSNLCILGALMHQLLRIAFGVLKHQTPFTPNWNNRSNPCPTL